MNKNSWMDEEFTRCPADKICCCVMLVKALNFQRVQRSADSTTEKRAIKRIDGRFAEKMQKFQADKNLAAASMRWMRLVFKVENTQLSWF